MIGNWEQYPNQQLSEEIIILSHGNGDLERGFSINENILVANLEADSLIAQSMIFDSVIAASYRGRKDWDYCFNGTFCNECTFMIQGWIKGNETRRK